MKTPSTPSRSNCSLLGGGTALLTILACKGAGIVVALLSLFGMGLTVNPHVQAAVISLFALLTAGFVFLGFRSHRRRAPLALAVVAALTLIATMYVSYNGVVEGVALTGLLLAAIGSWMASKRGATSSRQPKP